MEAYIIDIIERFGYFGVFLMIAVENIFPPIPSEVILGFGGFMTTKSSMLPWGVIASATVGAVVGAVALYLLGSILGQARVEKLVDKYGHILRLRNSDIQKAYGWFEKYENKTVFFCRMIPIIRSLISIPAGMAKMDFTTFLTLTILGSTIWNTIIVYAGVLLGESWSTIIVYLDMYSYVVYAAVAVILICLVVVFVKRKK